MVAYGLTYADREVRAPESPCSDPVIRAAANADSRILTALLVQVDSDFDPSAYIAPNYGTVFHYDSALLAAINAGLKDNVDVLLQQGANPNGLPNVALSQWSTRFLRFRPYLPSTEKRLREDVLRDISHSQMEPLTVEELGARGKTRARFWAEPDFPPLSSRIEPAMTALEAAIAKGDISIVDAILHARPDTAAWKQHYQAMPPETSASYLATSTPLHRAIETGRLSMVSYLLDLGFAADCFPLAAITRCLNPLMATLTTNPPNLEAYKLLAVSEHADHNVRTPIYSIHILHIATATLSLPVLCRVSSFVPILSAGLTTLGHTLLHIACLPATDDQINHFSPKIHASIHELRTLSTTYRITSLWPHKPRSQLREYSPRFPFAPSTDHWPAQREVVDFLISNGAGDVASQDVHGNTALHYLAGHRVVNEALVHALRVSQGNQDVWTTVENEYGYTPQDLYNDGKAALAGIQQETTRYMPHWRDPMGSWVMGRWRSDYPDEITSVESTRSRTS